MTPEEIREKYQTEGLRGFGLEKLGEIEERAKDPGATVGIITAPFGSSAGYGSFQDPALQREISQKLTSLAQLRSAGIDLSFPELARRSGISGFTSAGRTPAAAPAGLFNAPLTGFETKEQLAGIEKANADAQREEIQKRLSEIAGSVPPGVAERRTPTIASADVPTPAPRPASGLLSKYQDAQTAAGVGTAQSDAEAARKNLQDVENRILAEAETFRGERVSSAVINKKLVRLDQETSEELRQARSRVTLAESKATERERQATQMFNFARDEQNQAQENFRTLLANGVTDYAALLPLAQAAGIPEDQLRALTTAKIGNTAAVDAYKKALEAGKIKLSQIPESIRGKVLEGMDVEKLPTEVTAETKKEVKASDYDAAKREAAAIFAADRAKNGDKKISPDVYEAVRSKIPASLKDDFDDTFKEYLSDQTREKFAIPLSRTARPSIDVSSLDIGGMLEE